MSNPVLHVILGNTPQIEALRAQIERLVGFDAPGNPRVPTILLQGETGCGKGLFAHVIHDTGPRAGGPFIDVNCGAIPEAMIEAELFGYEAGAFTDARRAKPGLFEAASGGTLFLDEIDSLAPGPQSKLLKAIEDKRVRRLGAVDERHVDAKLIAATQVELSQLVQQGRFRADLYHRLTVVVLTIPPLRQRPADAILLAEHFLRSHGEAHGLPPKRLGDDARAWIAERRWPGNVRELRHLMERVTLLAISDEIDSGTLTSLCVDAVAGPFPTLDTTMSPTAEEPGDRSDQEEAVRIHAALSRTGGNVLRAARLLGIGRNALRYRMRRHGIGRPDVESETAPSRSTDARTTPSAGSEASGKGALTPASSGSDAQTPTAWEPKPIAVLTVAITLPSPGVEDDPVYEPWTAAKQCERAIAERIEGFGGVFLQRSPVHLTAAFGIPRALEQASHRAVQAALAIRRAVGQLGGPRPEIRAAVHAGELRIDTAAADPIARSLPIGDVIALPERLLGHADAGEILVSDAVARRVAAVCLLQERRLQLGPSERITAHSVSGARPRAGVGAMSHNTPTRFVGREREIGVLRDAFTRAASGQGQIVFIAGEAGLGKSRLLSELRRLLAGQPHRWIEGHCASYGTNTPFLPIIDGIRRHLGIDDLDDDTSAKTKIAHEIERLGETLSWTLPYVQQALSLEVGDSTLEGLDSASRRSELFRALRALTMRAAEIEPVVLVVEDLHWIDPASEEYLTFLADAVPGASVLLVLSHRSGYSHPFGDRSYHVRVTLSPLSGDDMASMTRAILGAIESPRELRDLIAGKAEGNPFFVEELTKSLLEDGSLRHENGRIVLGRDVREISVPDTIQDILIARLDRLAGESKRAIQVASVIGREFALRLLARITDAGDRIRTQVDELRGLELIYEKAVHPELAYMFKHALTHDVAYESVLRERRKALHRTIGLAVEELYGDRLAEHYETLAHHFGRGEDWEPALRYHERSADKAAASHANRAAAEHARSALRIVDRLGDRVSADVRRRLNERLGRACFFLSQFGAAATAYEAAAGYAAEDLCGALDLCTAAYCHFWGHDYEASERCVRGALERAGGGRAPVAEAVARTVRGFHDVVLGGRLSDYDRTTAEALAVCRSAGHEASEAFVSIHRLQMAEWTAGWAHVIEPAQSTIALGRKLRAPEIIILATWFLGKARCCTGDFGGALDLLHEAHDLCERIGDRAWRSRLLNTLGWCLEEIGDAAEARRYNERAAVLAREIGDPEILSNAAINLAANNVSLGHLEDALEHLEPIEQALSHPGDPWMRWRYSLHALHVRGLADLAGGRPEKALAAAAQELAQAGRSRAPKIEARALLLRGESFLGLERREEAAEELQQAIAVCSHIGWVRGAWQAHALLAQCERRRGNTPASLQHEHRARELAQRAAATLSDGEQRRRLLAAVAGARNA